MPSPQQQSQTRYVDRGAPIEGVEKTARDARVPFSFPRSIENCQLPDKRIRRRPGFAEQHSPVVTQAVCKVTGTSYNKRMEDSQVFRNTVTTTPLSYGLIKWNDDYQLRKASSKTIEFMVRLGDQEELVKNSFVRLADYTAAWSSYQLRAPGVFLLDQCLLSNLHEQWDHEVTSGNSTPAAGTAWDLNSYLDSYDVFPLSTFHVVYTTTGIYAQFTLVDSSSHEYMMTEILSYNFTGTYTVGSVYHVAITFNHTTGVLSLVVNGSTADTFTLAGANVTFAGDYDYINGTAYATGQKRDIVVLNECTVRGSYSSTCRIRTPSAGLTDAMHGHQVFNHAYSVDPNTVTVPWACSPPRGTAMWDLRIWKEARSTAQLSANMGRHIVSTESGLTNLVGNWWMNDGGPICSNKVTGKGFRYLTLHHGYSGFLKNDDLLHGLGLKLTDGQHLIKSTTSLDTDLGSGFHAKLASTFGWDEIVTPGGPTPDPKYYEKHSFTVQIQLTVTDLQAELNKDAGHATLPSAVGGETRDYIEQYAHAYALLDGSPETAAARFFIGDHVAYTTRTSHRAYDQTLWSIEGTQIDNGTTTSTTNEAATRRIPLARGLLTPSGKIAFELYRDGSATTANRPRLIRLISTNALTVGNTYTLTFVYKPVHTYSAGAVTVTDMTAEIWAHDITGASIALLEATYDIATTGAWSGSLRSANNIDVVVGASYVQDNWDHSIQVPFVDPAVVGITRTSYVDGGTSRGNHGPWPVTQRFMSPYQDSPGSFILGFFRLWSTVIPSNDIQVYGNSSIGSNDYTPDLLINTEIASVAGPIVPNQCRYATDYMVMGFKSWGMPQGYLNNSIVNSALTVYLKEEMYHAAWAMEDCLGYTYIPSKTTPVAQRSDTYNPPVTCIAPFKSTLAQQFGIVAAYGSALAFDAEADGTYNPLYIQSAGLLNEFSPNADWQGTLIGERTILTSIGGIPKVYNGNTCTLAGFRRWSGGKLLVYPQAALAGGGLTTAKWYGIAVVYFSETYGTYQVSPVVAVYLNSVDGLNLYFVPAHPDPRITVREVFRTVGQETKELALAAPLYKTRVSGLNANAPTTAILVDRKDEELTPAVLDRNITEFPVCAYSASLNNQLYLAGSSFDPDGVYFSDPSNPERFDTLVNRIPVSEGSGDLTTGLISAFGALWLFKPNAIWRIDNLGGNQHQTTRMFGVGAISPKSIIVYADPDSGQTTIFFWSQHGPYIFNGQAIQYIGSSIEDRSANNTTGEYSWLDVSSDSVVAAHNIKQREIICIYKSKVNGTTIEREGKAVVYNYRHQAWYTYTGMIGRVAMSTNLTSDLSTQTSPDNELVKLNASTNHYLLLGGDSGRIYKFGDSTLDAQPTGSTIANPYAVNTLVANVLTIKTFTPTQDFTGVWITIVDADTGEWASAPVDSYDGAGNFTLDAEWTALWSFTPAEDDPVYVCFVPSYVQFPWDIFERPYYDKQIVKLITWHNGAFKIIKSLNYDSTTRDTEWADLADANSKRKVTSIGTTCEAFKLELASFDLDAALDAFAYVVEDRSGATTIQ